MKRRFLVLISFLFGAAILIQSCSKDEVAPLTSYNVPKGTIKGKTFAELDLTTAGYENVPSGTKLMLRISVAQYGIDPGDSRNAYKTYEATVGATGDYSFTVDATTAGVSTDLVCIYFEYNQVTGKNANNQPITVRRIYYFNQSSVSVIAGQTVYRDIYYTAQ